MKTYKIVRYSKKGDGELIADGLTLTEARKHCDEDMKVLRSEPWVGQLFSADDGIETLDELEAAVKRRTALERAGRLNDEWDYLHSEIRHFESRVRRITG